MYRLIDQFYFKVLQVTTSSTALDKINPQINLSGFVHSCQFVQTYIPK